MTALLWMLVRRGLADIGLGTVSDAIVRWALGALAVGGVLLAVYVTGRHDGAARCERRHADATAALNATIAALTAKQAADDARHRAALDAAVAAAAAEFQATGAATDCRPFSAATRRRLDAIHD